MYVWELVACRLRSGGWDVWHAADPSAGDDPAYSVHLRRGGVSCVVSGPTLTEAYAAAARRAREHGDTPAAPAQAQGLFAPHFGFAWSASRA